MAEGRDWQPARGVADRRPMTSAGRQAVPPSQVTMCFLTEIHTPYLQ